MDALDADWLDADWLEGVMLDRLDKLEGVLLDALEPLCDETLDGVLLEALDKLEGVLDDAVLAELSEHELIELRLDLVDDGLPRLLTLDSVELIVDSLIDCEVDVLVFELTLLTDDTLELLAVLLLLGDSDVAELSDLELTSDDAVEADDAVLTVERLLSLSLVNDSVDPELLAVEMVELLTSDEGVLPVLPPVL